MAKLRTVQTNFTAGVLDESMRSRIDMNVYRNGIKVGENIRLRPQGGATRRAGSVALDDYTFDAQVEPFVFDDDEQYVFFFRSEMVLDEFDVLVADSKVDVYDRFTRTLVTTIEHTGAWTPTHITDQALSILQQYDKMFVSHVDFNTVVITRTGLSTFTTTTTYFEFGRFLPTFGPMHKYAATDTTLTPGATSGATTMTSSVAFWSNPDDLVTAEWRFRGKRFAVTSIVSSTVANVTILEALPDTSASIDWEESAFSFRRGWIRCLGLHENRMWIGGGRDCPNVVWGSVAGVPLNFDLGTAQPDDAIKYAISGRRVVNIKAIESFTHLQFFTSTGEHYAPQPVTGGLTPTNFSVKQTSAYGCGNIPPRIFDQSTIFVTRGAKALREFAYDDIRVSYVADSLTFMGKSMAPSPIDLEIQIEGVGDEQEARAYVPNEDGTIGILSKVKKEEIAAWSRWTTEGSYKRACVIDSELWMLVERTINGVTGKYIEIADNDAYLDFSASLSGAASTSWGPFNLHKGQSVHVLSGNLYFGEIEVDATTGMIELPIAVTEVQIGLNFTPRIEPLLQEVQMADGITMGEFKRYVSVTAMLESTMSCKIKNRNLPSVLPEDDPGQAPDARSGPFKVWTLGWSKTETPVITSPQPLPFTVNSLVFEVEV